MNKLNIIIILLLFSFIIGIPFSLQATANESDISSTDTNISQENQSKSINISKNSTTYKSLVILTIISIIIVIIVARSIILNLFGYAFIISSIGWTIYLALPIFSKTEKVDYTSLVLGIILSIASIVVFQIINGKTFSFTKDNDDNLLGNTRQESDLLIKRAKLAFLTLKNEMSLGKFNKVIAFTDDKLYEELSILLDSMKSENYKINYDDLIVKQITIKKKAFENQMNKLYMEITAWASSYKTDLKTNKIIESSIKKGEFKEIFCFSRKAGCKPASKGLIEGYCPRCGTLIKGNRSDKCVKCNNELRSGEFDVVLTNISYPD